MSLQTALVLAIIFFIYEFLATMDAYGPKIVIGILPLLSGFFAGILLGNVALGATIGAITQLIALGAVPMGGAVPPDFGMVAITAVVLSSIAGLDPMVAIVLALPAGILGMYFDIIGRTVNISLVHRVDKLIEEGEIDEIDKWHLMGMPILGLFRGVAVAIAVFIVTALGGEALKTFLESLPKWVLDGLAVAGAVLPAMGLGLILTYLGLGRYKWYFIIAFLLVSLINISFTFAIVIIAGFIIIWYKYRGALKIEGGEGSEGVGLPKEILRSSKLRSVLFFESSWNYELMQGLGYLFSILPILKHIYKGDELKNAAKAHLEFFNTNPVLAPMVVGLDGAIENTRRGDLDFIRKLKIGLMGPLAGFGDSVIWLATGGVLLILAITLINGGLVWAPLIFIIAFDIVTFTIRFKSFDFGYNRGLSLVKVFSEERMRSIREFAETLAIFSVGAIIPIVFQVRPVVGAEVLATIDASLGIFSLTLFVSALIGLGLTLLAEYLYSKGFKIYYVLVVLFAIGFILGALGILGAVGYVEIPSS
ncbi:MAG: PTS system mannose/fructose/sorbose family transporter subunit IID [Candidatus Njordarchaeales archaeon]